MCIIERSDLFVPFSGGFWALSYTVTLLFLDMEVKQGFHQLICFAVKDNVTTFHWTSSSRNMRTCSEQRHILDESLVLERTQNSFPIAKIPGLKNADVLNNAFSTVLTMTTHMLSNQVPPWG